MNLDLLEVPVQLEDDVLSQWSQSMHPEPTDNTEEPESEGLEKLSRVVARMPNICFTPHSKPLFFLRQLLQKVKGPKSFADVRTVDGVVYDTYQEAAVKLGLFDDDTTLEQTLEEAYSIKFGKVFRHCFVMLLINAAPTNPKDLWEKFKARLCEDYLKNTDLVEPTPAMIDRCLIDLSVMFKQQGHDMTSFGLPEPSDVNNAFVPDSVEIEQELNYDQEVETESANENYQKLNPGQKEAFDTIADSVEKQDGGLFFIGAPGGTGKTFLISTLLSHVRGKGDIAVAMATSGIAATLLPGGGTVHTKMKVPIDINEKTMCNFADNSPTADLVKKAKLMIIDEATLGNKLLYECLDRTFREHRKCDMEFGGITMVFCGDWRQCLPVVPGGGPSEIMHYTLKMSYLWKKVIMK